jgi:hypothetical protein
VVRNGKIVTQERSYDIAKEEWAGEWKDADRGEDAARRERELRIKKADREEWNKMVENFESYRRYILFGPGYK